MKLNRLALASAATLALFGSIGAASLVYGPKTWVVDDDGGKGVHFTEIGPAIAAASNGDVILVRPGIYSSFTLQKALTIIGSGLDADVVGDCRIQDAPGVVVLAELDMDTLGIVDCDETVILDAVLLFGSQTSASSVPTAVMVQDCADVRFIDSVVAGGPVSEDGGLGIRVVNSRVEFTGTNLYGHDGQSNVCNGYGYGGDGGSALRIQQQSRVHLVDGVAWGGYGGDALSVFCLLGFAGEGAEGISIGGTQTALILTDADVRGGDGGTSTFGYCGDAGDAVLATGSWQNWPHPVRHSGTTLSGGAGGSGGYGPCANGKNIQAPKNKVTPGDPRLERIGTPIGTFPGSQVTLRVHGEPGTFTRLFLGVRPQVLVNPAVEIELLVERLWTHELGFMPAVGYVDHTIQLGPQYPKEIFDGHRLLIGQGMCIYPGGEIRRTNSVPLVLR